jgi:hypothetical protein
MREGKKRIGMGTEEEEDGKRRRVLGREEVEEKSIVYNIIYNI